MSDTLEKIFGAMLAVLLMFIFPILDSFERIDDLSYMSVYSATVKFVDAVKNTGKITPEMYMEFQQILNATGNKYNIQMIHRKGQIYPIYSRLVQAKQSVLAQAGQSMLAQANAQHDTNLEDNSPEVTWNIDKLYDEFYTEQILYDMNILELNEQNLQEQTNMDLYQDYDNFNVGDYFYVSVKNVTTTPAMVVKRMLYGQSYDNYSILVPYGGEVRNYPNSNDANIITESNEEIPEEPQTSEENN